MLVLYRAEQGYESRTQPQLQLRRRGCFSPSTWTSYLWYEHHAACTSVCALWNVTALLTNVLVTVRTLQSVENSSVRGGKVVWLGCVADSLLCSYRVAPLRSKHRPHQEWAQWTMAMHHLSDTHCPTQSRARGRHSHWLTCSCRLCFWSFPLRVLALAQPGCLMWLYKVAHFVSLRGVSGLQCFHCESHPWVSFRRMRPYWESLSVFICLPFATDCIQLHSWIPTAVPRQHCRCAPPGSGTFSQTVAKGCLFLVAHDTANRTLDCV